MHPPRLLASIILICQPSHALPCTRAPARITHRSTSSSASPLDPWVGTLYNGINGIRLTAITDTPLRLREALSNAAQAKADSLCAGDDQLEVQLSNYGIGAENIQTLVLQSKQSADDVIGQWAGAKLGKDSPLSAIMNPVYVYAGVGMCKDQWAVVLTSEFI
ncbi:hypothetical protein H4R99_001203 [Coemansia sp. RSA 1722]|nr:hypothetical protein LPJ57_000515 [Coemansia sp. RSA 486]KAJ2237245.1 hypothetical protein IWW45_001120 [Coemansia sp. RSA 485]KAJ2601410.1 hypothetical protein GGF39_001257 [Coemansia sp. RSA 1721]KAJ2605344.1 hypothetical protein H4R99_001203 [Coemansia sp. RSA 1722]KAJ2638789.1 hypothetical protein GGF40_001387 [Coemansia sp. RSA 1286]